MIMFLARSFGRALYVPVQSRSTRPPVRDIRRKSRSDGRKLHTYATFGIYTPQGGMKSQKKNDENRVKHASQKKKRKKAEKYEKI